VRSRWLLLLCALLALPALAREAPPLAEDPVLEARVQALAQNLRCLVCQNETIAASQSALAIDLRQQVRSQLQRGESEAKILDYMVARYGDFVLYRPPVKAQTWLLWLGPFALLLLAAGALVRTLRRRPHENATPLSADEARRARQLLAGGVPSAENAP
jgi:cytochrome c-type biogenesis protein CcmH